LFLSLGIGLGRKQVVVSGSGIGNLGDENLVLEGIAGIIAVVA
jgi:hypothetical protein